MINNRFVLYQVKREIKRNGINIKFYRREENRFGEPGDYVFFREYRCLYHEHAAHMLDTYRVLTGQTEGITRTEKMPQLMIPYDDFYFKDSNSDESFKGIEIGDVINLNGRILRVSGVLNVQEWNLLMDVSFEEVDEGGNTGIPS